MKNNDNISDLIPHSGKMILLDTIHDRGDNWVECCVSISSSSMFYEDEGVSSIYALEYMAQTAAVLGGLKDKNNNNSAKIGYITGCRKFNVEIDKFRVGQQLIIRAEEVFNNGNMSSFDCQVLETKLLASARISVYVQNKSEK